jgi:hypothetical protein
MSTPLRRTRRRTAATVFAAVLAAAMGLATACSGPSKPAGPSPTPVSTQGPSVSSSPAASTSPAGSGKSKPVFIIYYLWWDHSHWTSHLGPSYPSDAASDPLPASLNSSSCGTSSNYRGNQLTDVSQGLTYDQSKYSTILNDVKEAAATGATGFAVNWLGTGSPTQTTSSNADDQRLAYVFQAVQTVNQEGIPFKIILDYQSSANKLPMSQFYGDFTYFLKTYGNSPYLDHTYSTRPEVVMSGTWKYTDSDIEYISNNFRPRMYLIGDEKPSSWDAARAEYLDGTSYYFSSQNPYTNPTSFAQLVKFARTVREVKNPDGSTKTWLAPFTPGYNATLLYGTPTCVPRDDGQTMHKIYDGNLATDPDGWTLISWNEISEGSYIVPLTRYGDLYTNTLADIIRTGR